MWRDWSSDDSRWIPSPRLTVSNRYGLAVTKSADEPPQGVTGRDELRLTRLTAHLIENGRSRLAAPIRSVPFTGIAVYDELLNDLAGHPHAFVFACLVDRQIRAELAWSVPGRVRERLGGTFELDTLARLSEDDWVELIRKPSVIHRLPETMANTLHLATRRIVEQWDGNAAAIWNDRPGSARLVRRFLAFHGAGPKIATMAANILVRDFHIDLADQRYIDISADIHVRRVMHRLGYVQANASVEDCIYAAREVSPAFPGIFDLALWEVGRSVCRPKSPACESCPLRELCIYRADWCTN